MTNRQELKNDDLSTREQSTPSLKQTRQIMEHTNKSLKMIIQAHVSEQSTPTLNETKQSFSRPNSFNNYFCLKRPS